MKSPGSSLFLHTQCTGPRPAAKTFNLLPRKFLFPVLSLSSWAVCLALNKVSQLAQKRSPDERGRGRGPRFKRVIASVRTAWHPTRTTDPGGNNWFPQRSGGNWANPHTKSQIAPGNFALTEAN